MNVEINVAVLLAVILFFRLRAPSDKPKSPGSVQVTAALSLILGLLLVGTKVGEILLAGVQEVVAMLN